MMIKLTAIIGKEIVNTVSAVSYGRLINTCMTDNRTSHLVTEGMEYIAVGSQHIGAVITTDTAPTKSPTDCRLLTAIGGRCIDTSGNMLGTIVDYEYNSKMQLTRIVTDKQNYTTARLLSMSADYIILSRSRIVPPAASTGDTRSQQSTGAASAPPYTPIPTTIANYSMTASSQPVHTVVSDYSFLIGRRVTRDIYTKDNKRLVCANNIINTEILTRVRMYNKLVELAIYSELLR